MWPDDSGSFLSDYGYQSNGTFNSPVMQAQPADAGGGAPANYGQNVLDVFKFGVGVWQQQQSQQQLLDYRRWEATQGAVNQQGQTAGVRVSGGGISPKVLIIGAVLLVGAIALAKG